MSLTVDARLGPYRIVAPLGAGGMGQVYKAHDTRLKRTVAIKILPAHLAPDPQRRARFDREARAIAALNHPNICALYDVGEHQGIAFLVMELIEGETLAERLHRGALPIDRVLRAAIEIADALDKAHRAGVVHRDLKPGNIMLTRSGVKLLDFGLAKTDATTFSGIASAAPTAAPITAQGTLLGTLQYMAPEQLEGKDADARTDIFAFGAVVYEMATGKKAFEGKNQASLIAAIIDHEPPPIATTQPLTPAALEHIVKRCLTKDPDDRWQTARDLREQLRWIADGQTSARTLDRAGTRRWGLRDSLVVVAAIAVGFALVAVGRYRSADAATDSPRRVVRFTVDLPAARTIDAIALAPDGTRVAYSGVESGQRRLYVRALDRPDDVAVPGTEGAASPFFSSDGEWIAFFAGSRLKKINARGGDVLPIADVGASSQLIPSLNRQGGAWTADGRILFASIAGGLVQVDAAGGAPVTLTSPTVVDGDNYHMWPRAVPGDSVLFTVSTGQRLDRTRLDAVSRDGRSRTRLADSAALGQYVGTGHLLYVAAGRLVAAPFDPQTLRLGTAAVPVLDDIAYSGQKPLVALSDAGDLAYVEGIPPARLELIRVDRRGRLEPITLAPPGGQPSISLSSDGTKIALFSEDVGRTMSMWIIDLVRATQMRFTSDSQSHVPVWLPDGHGLVFSSDRAGPFNLFVQAADGGGAPRPLVSGPGHQDPAAWSRDGRWLVYAEMDPKTGYDVWAFDGETRRAHAFRRTAANEQHPTLSPDGHWIAYESDESGRREVFAEAFPQGGRRLQLSVDGGFEPNWSPLGGEVFYRNGGHLMSVRVAEGDALSAAAPQALLQDSFEESGAFGPRGYAVSPDARYFYFMRTPSGASLPRRISVIVNWLEEFRRRLISRPAR